MHMEIQMPFITYLFIVQFKPKSYNQIIIGNLREEKQLVKNTKARFDLSEHSELSCNLTMAL